MRLRVLMLVVALLGVFASGASACCSQGELSAPQVEHSGHAGHKPIPDIHAPQAFCAALCGALAAPSTAAPPGASLSIGKIGRIPDLIIAGAATSPDTPPPRRA